MRSDFSLNRGVPWFDPGSAAPYDVEVLAVENPRLTLLDHHFDPDSCWEESCLYRAPFVDPQRRVPHRVARIVADLDLRVSAFEYVTWLPKINACHLK